MLPRRGSVGSRAWSGPLLALSASCSWGCPQLLSDEFMLSSPTDPTAADPAVVSGEGGTGGSAGAAGNAGNGGSGGGSGGAPATAPGPPSVVSVSPSNGSSGVAADAVVTLTFSEAMNTSAVQSAYSSLDLPASSVSFSWSNADTVLQIAPKQPLTRATGSDPAATTAKRYAFELGTAALDLEGDALPRFSSSFTTLREINQTLAALQDRSLTGNFRSDDVYGDNSCEQADPDGTICIGDSSNDNSTYRGFVTFDLSGLPAQIQEISAAQLSMSVDSIRNSPFAGLGSLVAEHVSFDSISLAAFGTNALGSVINLSSSALAGAQVSASALSAVRDDLPARGHSQFRLRFTSDSDSDDVGDLIEVLSASERLAVTYLIP